MRRPLVAWLLGLCATGAMATGVRGQEPGGDTGPGSPVLLRREIAAAIPQLKRNISLRLEGVSLERALETIARQADLPITYNDAILPREKRVWLTADDIRTDAALERVLRDSGLQLLPLSSGQLVVVKSRANRPESVQGGTVVGRVSDAKTAAPIAGATVVVEGTSRSGTTGNDGGYRITEVAPGTYTVRARYIGYAPGTASVTVSADQEATADLALEKSVQRLDEVVTTGTVVPTEVKALPTPISVVTGDEIEQKGYQRLDQIFRGNIPGAFAWDNGATVPYNTSINIRGASSLVGGNSVKTYIDGVEVADPIFLTTVDPASIERVEVLRGPEGSTIYGSNALNGVMQVFTRKGDWNTTRPQIEAKLSGGFIQSPWESAAQQDHSLSITGGSSDLSYRVGGGYVQHGDWVPNTGSKNTSLSGGLRGRQGPLTVDLSARYYGSSFGVNVNPDFVSLFPTFFKLYDETDRLSQQTYGVTIRYAATQRWQHTLTLGYDRSGYDSYLNTPRFLTPDDSLYTVHNSEASKASVAYNTTFELSFGPAARSSLTAGVDHWTTRIAGFDAFAASTNVNTIPSPDQGTLARYDNTGFFAQEQLALWDALFLTAGLRAEDNQNFGQDFGLAVAPRVGASYTHAFGGLTAKVRAAWGKAIRPPVPGIATAFVTPFSVQLENPNLGPEEQQGADGGIELYFGRRGSLEVTYYDQKAIDLIDFAVLQFLPVYTGQYQNVGRIRNKGWEFGGRLTAGPLSLTGTYSITDSRVQTLSPSYTGDLRPGDRLLRIPHHTAGAAASYAFPSTTMTLDMTYMGPWPNWSYRAIDAAFLSGQFTGSFRDYWAHYDGFAKLNAAVSQVVNRNVSVFVRSDNVTNNQVSEVSDAGLNTGRVTTIGIRAKF
jgi:outer membrane receptor protein involved in Fe transport